MSQALFGLAGVLLGGMVTAGVQAYHARTERQVQARSAARLLRAAVEDMRMQLVITLKWGEWVMVLNDWSRFDQLWTDNRGPLSSALSEQDFMIVALTFRSFESLREQRTDHLEQLSDGRSSLPNYDDEMRMQLTVARDACEAAHTALADVARTWRERRSARKAPPLSLASREAALDQSDESPSASA